MHIRKRIFSYKLNIYIYIVTRPPMERRISRTLQAYPKNETLREEEVASSSSGRIWKRTWNQPATQMRDECFSEASPASQASAASTASPAQQPITIQHGLTSWTRLNSAGYIKRPAPVSARDTTA